MSPKNNPNDVVTIYLGADHAGFALKETIARMLGAHTDYAVVDCGARTLDDDDDYPDFILPVAHHVAQDRARGIASMGIVCGGSGQGEAMAANRVVGVRCALYYGGAHDLVVLSREHNDANMLSLGARFLRDDEAMAVVRLWLATAFSGEARHVRRLAKF